MLYNIKHNTISALLWSLFDNLGQQGIRFVISIILARLLLPEQFGLLAIIGIFMAVAHSIIDSGFGSALIQKQNATHEDESSIFYFNILVGFLTAVVMFLSAPWIAGFYNVPLLAPIIRVLSLNLFIGSFGIIQSCLLTKRLDFKSQMKVSLIGSVISGAIGVTMAYRGYGVWSLVALSLSGTLIGTFLLWYVLPWRPAWKFSFTSLRSMFSYGSKMLMSGLLDTIFRNLYLIVIGKLFSANDLGFYTRAQGIQQLPVTSLSGVIGRVTFPVFSAMQEDTARLKRNVRKALATLALLAFPMMVGLALVARPLVLVMLTEKWLPCVPYLQLLCVSGMLWPLHVINLNVLMAQGRSDLFFRLEIVKKVNITLAILLTWRWGIAVMIYGQIATSLIAYYLNSYYTGKLLSYPITEQVKDFLPSLGVSFAMGLVVYAVGFLPLVSAWTLLPVQILTGLVVYAILCLAFKIQAFEEIMGLLRAGFKQRFGREGVVR